MSASKQTFYDYQVQQAKDNIGCEWQEVYEGEQLAADHLQWQIEEPQQQPQEAVAQVTEPSFMDCLVASHDAVQSTLGELTTLLMNVGSSHVRNDVHRIATNLINKSGLMEESKLNYQSMINAATASSQQFFNHNMAVA